MPRLVERLVYKFSELSDHAKEKARAWYREADDVAFNVEHSIDEFKELLTATGFQLNRPHGRDEILWDTNPISAAFGATWSARNLKADACNKILADRPATWTHPETQEVSESKDNAETTRIVRALLDFANAYPQAYATVATGRGCSQSCDCTLDIDRDGETHSVEKWNALVDDDSRVENDFCELVSDMASQLATQINAEFEYRSSDECVDESVEVNEYDFNADGSIFS